MSTRCWPPPVARGVLPAGALNENAAHRLCGRREEVGAPVPFLILVPNQPKPGFVNERGGLQRMTLRFVGHLVRGQAPQFFIDQRQQFIGGSGIALLRACLKNGFMTFWPDV